MRTALKLYDIYGIFTFRYSLAKRFFTDTRKDAYIYGILTFLYSLAERFFTDTRKDAYSTEALRHIRHLYVSLQLSKTILYGYA